jgi:hypothetical protein
LDHSVDIDESAAFHHVGMRGRLCRREDRAHTRVSTFED